MSPHVFQKLKNKYKNFGQDSTADPSNPVTVQNSRSRFSHGQVSSLEGSPTNKESFFSKLNDKIKRARSLQSLNVESQTDNFMTIIHNSSSSIDKDCSSQFTSSKNGSSKSGSSTVSMRIYTAIFDYVARTEDDLSFSKKDYLEIIDKVSVDWWMAKCCQTGRQGYIPSNFVAPIKSIQAEPWYFGTISRIESERFLSQFKNSDGSYLVRTSGSKTEEHVLSVRNGDKVRHYRIKNNAEGGVYISSRNLFPSIHKLIQHYSEHLSGLCCILTNPCDQVNGPDTRGLSYNTVDTWEIRRDQVELKEKLGSGNFGDVYKGVWNKTTEIAVKTLKKGKTNQEDFLKEAQIMKSIRHPKLIQLYGVCTDIEPFYIVTEFMKHGSLDKYLRDVGHEITLLEKLTIATQVTSGMSYLESKNYIHRDLASRNVLVGEGLNCKVADFGLSKLLQESEYLAHEGASFPIRWTAPEALLHNRFSVKSDVWSFGVFLIEVFTNGVIPYPECTNHEVVERITNGYRMQKPKDCPQEIYNLMLDCWQNDPEARPSFENIGDTIDRYCVIINRNSYDT